MGEEFLQFIWKHGLYKNRALTSTSGEAIDVLHPGYQNQGAGSDFFNARIKIGDTVWAGNVEVHIKASDWYRHKHHKDKSYSNVILHVVHKEDISGSKNAPLQIPTLIIDWEKEIEQNYTRLLENEGWVGCEEKVGKMDVFGLKFALGRILSDRLQSKTEAVWRVLKETRGNWNEAFYRVLARSFGFKENGTPFEMLAISLPQKYLARHQDSLLQVEALLLGQAGLLEEDTCSDEYYLKLQTEYRYLSGKYRLKPIDSHLWKFMRMRPVNFPPLRIAQFAALVYRSKGLFSAITNIQHMDELRELFHVKASEYWDTHYHFNRLSPKRVKSFGKQSCSSILINVVVPFLFTYGESQNKLFLKNKALDLLEQMLPENNKIIRGWSKIGINARSAVESQALLHLKNNFCDKKRCLDCTIGQKIITVKHSYS